MFATINNMSKPNVLLILFYEQACKSGDTSIAFILRLTATNE